MSHIPKQTAAVVGLALFVSVWIVVSPFAKAVRAQSGSNGAVGQKRRGFPSLPEVWIITNIILTKSETVAPGSRGDSGEIGDARL